MPDNHKNFQWVTNLQRRVVRTNRSGDGVTRNSIMWEQTTIRPASHLNPEDVVSCRCATRTYRPDYTANRVSFDLQFGLSRRSQIETDDLPFIRQEQQSVGESRRGVAGLLKQRNRCQRFDDGLLRIHLQRREMSMLAVHNQPVSDGDRRAASDSLGPRCGPLPVYCSVAQIDAAPGATVERRSKRVPLAYRQCFSNSACDHDR